MELIQLIVLIAVVGVILWAVNTYIPMEPHIKQILNVVVIIALCLWLLSFFGLLPSMHTRVSSLGPGVTAAIAGVTDTPLIVTSTLARSSTPLPATGAPSVNTLTDSTSTTLH